MRASLVGAALIAAVAWVPSARASDCAPGTLNAKGTCDCPPGLSSHGVPGKSTCKKSNVGPIAAPTAAAVVKSSSGLVCPTGTALVAGGSFVNKKGKNVDIAELCVDKTEVTVASYGKCVDDGSCTGPATYDTNASWTFQGACNWKHPDGRAKHPVNCLTFGQARDYCEFKKQRLPTEYEWEWVARGKTKGNAFPWGVGDLDEKRGNLCGPECVAQASKKFGAKWTTKLSFDDGFAESAPVGSFPSGGASGVLNLAGNVAEFTLSWHGIYGTHVVVRGGAWTDPGADDVRTFLREKFAATDRSPHVGFRCVLSKDNKTLATPAKKPPTVGSRVSRGPDWKWGDQGKGTNGTVIEEANEDGWIQVRWDNDDENDYRWGAEDKYDLATATGFLPQACDKSGKSGTVEVGSKVILSKHRPIADDDNWVDSMEKYVGKTATVAKVGMYDKAGCGVVRVDVDSGAYVWRVRDLGLP